MTAQGQQRDNIITIYRIIIVLKGLKMKKIKRIKENIELEHYNKMMTVLKGGYDGRKPNTLKNLSRAITICFYAGLRINECQALRGSHIKDLIENKVTKIDISKTSVERKLYASDNFIKALKSLFNLDSLKNDDRVICSARGDNSGINNITFIQQVNRFIHYTLGDGYSSHSMRQSLITSMSRKSSPKHIAQFMAIDPKTVMGYITPSEEDIINCIVR